MNKLFSYIIVLTLLLSCSTDFPIRKFDGTTVLNYGPASKIKHFYDHRNLGENLEITIRPEKEFYYPLEEMAVLVTVKNISQRDSMRIHSPYERVFFVNDEGKKFHDGRYLGSRRGSGISLVRYDVIDRPVKRVGFPHQVLQPGELITRRIPIKIMPRRRFFGELASKGLGFPGIVPTGNYYPRFKHPHREFTSDRLPYDTEISLSNALPLRVVESTGKAKEKADCIIALAETIKSTGGLLVNQETRSLKELNSLRNEAEQIMQMEPVELYADLVKTMYDVLGWRIERIE
ncbi:MAG: hypothetical protein AAFP70_10820 [Calditrichota bacterium]